MRLYICVLNEVPDYIVPTLVAHSVLLAHEKFKNNIKYIHWYKSFFKKCVVRVNRKEFDKISKLPLISEAYENHTLNGEISCIVVCPCHDENLPNVLKFAKLWSPRKE
jgi:hypothetical protein